MAIYILIFALLELFYCTLFWICSLSLNKFYHFLSNFWFSFPIKSVYLSLLFSILYCDYIVHEQNFRCSGRSMLHKKSKVEFHPLGVIGAIVSWNYPFHNIFNPMLAAVFSGNSIVIKVVIVGMSLLFTLITICTLCLSSELDTIAPVLYP